MVKFASETALDKQGPLGYPFKPFHQAYFSAANRSRQEKGPAETVTKEAGRLLSKNMAVDLSIQGKKSPQKMAPRSNFWGLCCICGTFFALF